MRRLVTLTVIIAIGFGLRVHLLGNQELRGDEGFSWNYIQDPPAEILVRIIREGDPQPPLHYWLLWGWAQLTGDSEFAMRAESAFLSLLLIPLTYQVGRQLWREEVGLLAAGLTAIHPQQVWLAQDVRNMYQLALIALLTAILIVRRFHRESQTAQSRAKKIQGWLGYVACGTLAMYSHYYAIFPLIAHGAYVLWPTSGFPLTGKNWPGKESRLWLAAGLTIAALVAPWAFIILPVYSQGQLADPGALPFLTYAAGVLGDLTAGPAFPDSIKLIFMLAFALLGAIPFISRLLPPYPHTPTPPSPRLLIYSSAAFLIPFLGIYAIVALRSTFNTFYFVFAFPAAYLLVAGGVYSLWQKSRLIGGPIILVSLIAFVSGLNNHYADPHYSKSRGLREVAARLAEAALPGEVYLANFPDPAQVYYLRHLKLSYHMEPGSLNFDPKEVNAALERLLVNRLWFVPINAMQFDPDAYVQTRLLNTAILAEDDHFNKMRLMLFIPPEQAKPLAAKFADGIRLVGYHLSPNRLTLVWTAASPPTADYTIFVHADASDGYTLIGHDAPPRLPTSQWQPGQLLVDVHEFAIPTDQPLTLVAGLYSPTTGDRLKLETASSVEPEATLILSLRP